MKKLYKKHENFVWNRWRDIKIDGKKYKIRSSKDACYNEIEFNFSEKVFRYAFKKRTIYSKKEQNRRMIDLMMHKIYLLKISKKGR